MGRSQQGDGPTLAEAWAMIAAQLGLQVESPGEHAIHAHGIVRGRPVTVTIERSAARSEGWRFLAGINTKSSRNRRDTWHTMLSVGCSNPAGATGAIESAVDVNDPAWNPREYDPRSGRSVRSDPPDLAARALDADTHERLMSIADDITIHIGPSSVAIDHSSNTRPDSGATYVAGSVIHHFQGPPPPMPERAIVGPPWWIDLLCDIAETVER
jgi:hypothetical protein